MLYYISLGFFCFLFFFNRFVFCCYHSLHISFVYFKFLSFHSFDITNESLYVDHLTTSHMAVVFLISSVEWGDSLY